MRKIFWLATLLCFLAPHLSFATPVLDIKWPDLVPGDPSYDDLPPGLSEEQRGAIEWIIYLRQYLPEEIEPINQEFYDEMQEAMPKLKQKGIDVDKIIADRHARNKAINKELDGKEIRLSGYLLPLDWSGKAVKEFLLVPYVGACIHTPPPPPNQLVYAVMRKAEKFEIENLFRPVTAVGRLEVKSLTTELYLVDGSDDIDVGYAMAVDKVEKYVPEEIEK